MIERKADWDRAFEILYGHPAYEAEPGYQKPLKELGKAVGDMVLGNSKVILKQIALEATKVSLMSYLQYVFFVLMERSQEWPSMSKERVEALQTLRETLSLSGDVPNYMNGLRVAPDVMEQNIDTLLIQLATWSNTVFKARLRKEYLALVKKHTPAFLRALPGFDPQMVGVLLETTARTQPLILPRGNFLAQVFSTLL
jgi:hypothetical protein